MDRIYLKKRMLDDGISLIGIAAELGVSTNAMYLVISGKTSSKKIESALEKVFGIPIAEIRKAWNSTPTAEEFAARRHALLGNLGLPA